MRRREFTRLALGGMIGSVAAPAVGETRATEMTKPMRVAIDECYGVILDVQDYFLGQLERSRRPKIWANIASFARLLGYFRIPIIVTSPYHLDTAARGQYLSRAYSYWEQTMALERRPATTHLVAALTISLWCGTAQGQTTIKVDGSMGSMPLVQALAKAFQGRQAGISIEFGQGLNPKARIDALANETIDIALASHGLDVDALAKRGMPVTEIARTAVVFAVNASVTINSLTNDQVCGIFAGRITNWKEVGGPELAIASNARPESEVDTEVIRDGVSCLKSLNFAPTVKIIPRASDMVRELTGTAGAIGVTTTTVVEQSGGKIRGLSLNGVAANDANVTSGKYGIIREFFLVVRKNATPQVQQFVTFIGSPEGAAIIKANGALPSMTK